MSTVISKCKSDYEVVSEMYLAALKSKNQPNKKDSFIFEKIDSDGNIDAFKQGEKASDCYLLSSLISLRNNPVTAKILKENIKKNNDDSITITFPGAIAIKNNNRNNDNFINFVTGEYTITLKEFNEAKNSGKYSYGDDDVLLYELAFEKYRKEVYESNSVNNLPNKGNRSGVYTGDNSDSLLDYGISIDAIFVLTAKQGKRLNVKGNENSKISRYDLCQVNTQLNEEDVKNISNYLDLLSKKPLDYISTASFNIDGSMHSVSIKTVTDRDVILIDPYDSEKEIIMPREQFIEKVRNIGLVNLRKGDENESNSFMKRIVKSILKFNNKFWDFILNLF